MRLIFRILQGVPSVSVTAPRGWSSPATASASAAEKPPRKTDSRARMRRSVDDSSPYDQRITAPSSRGPGSALAARWVTAAAELLEELRAPRDELRAEVRLVDVDNQVQPVFAESKILADRV